MFPELQGQATAQPHTALQRAQQKEEMHAAHSRCACKYSTLWLKFHVAGKHQGVFLFFSTPVGTVQLDTGGMGPSMPSPSAWGGCKASSCPLRPGKITQEYNTTNK